MRALRLIVAVLIASPILMLALSESSKLSRQPFAQVTAAPGPVPLTAPVAPGQPQPFSTIGALPALAAAPGFSATASAAATPRVFRCTCSEPGYWTVWTGTVSSSSYILAAQAASLQCSGYKTNDNPSSAFIPQAASTVGGNQKPTLYNGTAFTRRATVGDVANTSQSLGNAQLAAECVQCACN